MIYTPSESYNNMQLADEVSLEIYFWKLGENKFQKNNSEIF